MIVNLFLAESHPARLLFACLYSESHKYVCRIPRPVGECLLHSVVGIADVGQKVWTLPLILNLIVGRHFENSYD
jgi:hypothetical protein